MSKPILFSIIGAMTGLFVSQVGLYAESKAVSLYLFGAVLLVINFLLLWQKQTKRFTVINLGIVAIAIGLLISWNVSQHYYDTRKIAPLFIFALIQIGIIATTFSQAWKIDKPHYVYSDLFENGWNNHFFFLFSGLLTGGFLLILLLGTTLFKSIGLDVSDIIWNENITPIIVATLIGAGMGISREHESLIFKIRSVFFALFHVMAYLAAAIVILFAISLPFSWQGLFNNDATSIILLSLVGVSILLLNTWVDNHHDKQDKQDQKNKESEKSRLIMSLWKSRIFMLQLSLLPIFSLLSVYTIILRINQYGLMPNRIIALSIAIMLSLYSISYGYQMLKHRGQWRNGIIAANPLLALIWLGVLIALASPLLDPVRLSINNQLARLESSRISVEDFDFYALKYRLGKAGKDAIEEISHWEKHPDYAQIKQKLENPQDQQYRYEKTFLINVIGEDPKDFTALKNKYSAYRCNKDKVCFVTMLDMNRDNEKEALVIQFRGNHLSIDILQHKANKKTWTQQKHLSVYLRQDQSIEQAIKALKARKLQPLRPVYDDLKLGDIEVRE